MDSKTNIFKNPPGLPWGIFCLLCFLPFVFHSQTVAKAKNHKHHFGTVRKGGVVSHNFEITNTTQEPIYITHVDVSCSCTQVEFTTSPILPGQTTQVKIIFNTATLYGRQDREAEVRFNKGESVWLRYKCIVVRDKTS